MSGYDQFCHIDHFTRSGYELWVNPKKNNVIEKMGKAKKVTTNAQNTLFCIPADGSSNSQPMLSRLYTELDLREINYLQNKLAKNQIIESIDPHTVLVDMAGTTIFQHFKSTTLIAEKIRN
jgi:hypothetical protein